MAAAFLNMILADRSKTSYYDFFDDFDNYTAGDWTITETGTGTRAVQNERNGVLKITNAAADDNANFLQWSGDTNASTVETFKYEAGKFLYFGMRFKISDATHSDFVFGLQITDTTPLAVTDGIYFRKDDGDAYLDFVVVKDSTATTSTAIATLAADTYTVVEAYYDGSTSKIQLYVNGVSAGSSVLTNVPDDEELTLSFGVQNGEAAAKALSVDWVRVVQER